MYSPTLEEWNKPDDDGYIDGLDDREFVDDNPIDRTDSTGMSSRTFGDGSPSGGVVGPTLPQFPSSFTHPAPSSVDIQVVLYNDITGKLNITWDKVARPGPAGIAFPGVAIKFTFTPDRGVHGCDDLRWFQNIRSSVDDKKSYAPSAFTMAFAQELREHGGKDPFGGGFVGDNSSGDATEPYGEGYGEKLQGNDDPYNHTVWMRDTPLLPALWPRGVVVTKIFDTSLMHGYDSPAGLSIVWHTTQTAGDASKTLVSGMVTWYGR